MKQKIKGEQKKQKELKTIQRERKKHVNLVLIIPKSCGAQLGFIEYLASKRDLPGDYWVVQPQDKNKSYIFFFFFASHILTLVCTAREAF